jgi:hypothetical protein
VLSSLQVIVFLAFYGAIFGLSVWALVDLLLRPATAFVQAGKRTKTVWAAILGTATVVAFIALPITSVGASLRFVALGSAVAAVVYLVDVRPAVARYSGRGRGSGRW